MLLNVQVCKIKTKRSRRKVVTIHRATVKKDLH